MNRIREEIVAYLEESGLPRPTNIEAYIHDQTNTVLAILYADKEMYLRPEEEDPETMEGDYYRESIADYGSVYGDFPPPEDDD